VADAAADTLLVLALALSGEDCEALAADASVRRRARDEALDTGRLDREWLSQLLVGDGARRNAYSLAIGLDEAFLFLSEPRERRGALESAHGNWLESGRLSLSEAESVGALLPRRTPAAGEAAGDPGVELLNVVAVSPEAYRQVNHVLLFGRKQQPGRQRAGARPTLTLAGAPLVSEPDDLDWKLDGRGDSRRCRVRPKKGRLDGRIDGVMRRLHDSEAHIAIMPELTLAQPLIEAWEKALRRSAPSSKLKWLVAGTGPVGRLPGADRFNRAVLLQRDAQAPRHYVDKCQRFRLTSTEIERHGLGLDCAVAEEVNECAAASITVIEAHIGRIAIIVSDDLFAIPADLLVEWGVSLILSPALLTAQMLRQDEHAAAACARRIGTYAAIATTIIPDSDDHDGEPVAAIVHDPERTLHRVGACDCIWTAPLPGPTVP
jgi:hypothetical protein